MSLVCIIIDLDNRLLGGKRLPSTLQGRHNESDGVSNQQPQDCLLNCLFRRRSKKTLKLRVTGFCGGNSLVTVELPAQRARNAENVSIWWRHHGMMVCVCMTIGIEYFSRDTRMVCASLGFVDVWYTSIYPFPSELLHGHWMIWIGVLHGSQT